MKAYPPQLDLLLERLIPLVRRAERFLGPEDDWVEDDRRIVFEAAERYLGDYHTFVRRKGRADYVTTVNADSDKVERVLMQHGPYQRNVVSSRKYRVNNGNRDWAVGSFVHDGIDVGGEYCRQHHVYLFDTADGRTDVYAHSETSVLEGTEHTTDTQQSRGDPHVLFDVFDRAELSYSERQF